MNDYHEKRTLARRKEDNHKETLIQACKLALRLKDIERIKDVLKYAIESAEGTNG